ncbi:MAG: AAA family ATPase [Patescibacteria group bacterium]
MYLEKLEITGFKSFVNKTTFEFKKPYVAVVGPNGGGKTNVVDAIRWVMGEQSLKLIRLKKAEDAIFTGSKKLSRLGMAQVDLHLNNEDNRLNIDYPKVVISRKLFRNGDSEYTINKNKVRLQDIILLLAKANFGQRSYGIIGQGMVTDILNANPQDRKDFFNDACGVREFQIKRDQAINKLIRTEDNVEKADTLLGEIEPRLRSLRRQMNKLERRKEIEKLLEEIQIKYYGSHYKKLSDQIRVEKQKKDEAGLEHKKIREDIEELEKGIETLGREKSRTENYKNLLTEKNKLQDDKNLLIKEEVVLKGKLEVEQEKYGQTNLVWLNRRAEELKSHLTRKDEEITRNEDDILDLEKKLEGLVITQEKINTNFRELEYKLLKNKEELDKQISVLSVPEIRDKLKNIFVEQESFLKRLLKCNNFDAFKTIQKDGEEVTTHLAELLDQLYEQKDEEIARKKTEINALQKTLHITLEEKESILEKINDLRIKIQTKKEKNNLISESKEDENKEHIKIIGEIESIKKELGGEGDEESKLLNYQKKSEEIQNKINGVDKVINLVEEKISTFNEEEEKKKKKLMDLQDQHKKVINLSTNAVNSINEIDVALAKLETKIEDLTHEMDREMNEQAQKVARDIKDFFENTEELMIEIEKYKHQLELIGGIDPETIKEHEEIAERYDFLNTQSKDLKKTIMSLEKLIDSLDDKIKKQFNASFKNIASNFSKYFKLIFEGGSAKLSILMEEENQDSQDGKDEEDAEKREEEKNESERQKISDFAPLGKKKKKQKIVSGIEIEASPPGKKLKSVHALSGGEKSMTSIALICSIIDANTPPFVVLDEVEAALDEANSEKFAGIIRHLSKKTQFVVITHNRESMQKADILYGVTMNIDGTSHILSVKLDEAKKMTEEKFDEKK